MRIVLEIKFFIDDTLHVGVEFNRADKFEVLGGHEVQIPVSVFLKAHFPRSIFSDEILVDVFGKLIVKLIASPSSQLFTVTSLCFNEGFQVLSCILNVLRISHSLSSSHVLDCL